MSLKMDRRFHVLIRRVAHSLVITRDGNIHKEYGLVDYFEIQGAVKQTRRDIKRRRLGDDMLFPVDSVLSQCHFNLGVKYSLIVRTG